VLTVELSEFSSSGVVEWLLRLKNTGAVDAPVVEHLYPLNLRRKLGNKPTVPSVLHSSGCWDAGTGGVGWGSGIGNYGLAKDPLQTGTSVRLDNPGGGKTIFNIPFFNLVEGSGGLIGALGWPGRYLLTLSRPDDDAVVVTAGLESLHLSLHAGEEIRTPLVLLLPWQGDLADAHNRLRRHVLAHHTPQLDGKPATVPISHAGWGGMKTSTALELVRQITQQNLGYENFWMDAGWYGADRAVDEFQVFNEEDWFLHAGNWRVNRVPHPDGLAPISRAAHENGLKYLLWFEPERAVVGTPLTQEHPDWFLGEAATEFMGHSSRPYVRYRLFNFGNQEARLWMTDLISQRVEELGIDIYRQDCNFSLAPFWDAVDTPKRQGIAEIRYVEGLLQFWDDLRRRHPGLLLDLTQRGDLETITRGFDLTRSDYNIAPESDPMGNQAATMGLAHWRPHCGTMIQTRAGDSYHFRSAFCPGLSFSPFNVAGTRDQIGNFTAADFPLDWARKMVEQLKRARPAMYGDFYPLTSGGLDTTHWFGYQMHRPDLEEGFVLLLRRPGSALVAGKFVLRGLGETGEYQLEDADSLERLVHRGRVLLKEGLEIRIDAAPGSRLLFYWATARSSK